MWYLAEYENGEFRLDRNPREFTPVADYLRKQGRFKHLGADEVALIEQHRDETWKRLRKNWGTDK